MRVRARARRAHLQVLRPPHHLPPWEALSTKLKMRCRQTERSEARLLSTGDKASRPGTRGGSAAPPGGGRGAGSRAVTSPSLRPRDALPSGKARGGRAGGGPPWTGKQGVQREQSQARPPADLGALRAPMPGPPPSPAAGSRPDRGHGHASGWPSLRSIGLGRGHYPQRFPTAEVTEPECHVLPPPFPCGSPTLCGLGW